MGGMNYHIEIHFEDEVIWLARVRRFNATSPPPAIRDHILKSEFATYKFLEKTAVPAPRVYDFAIEGPNNPIGVGYILMEKLPGKSLRWSLLQPTEQTKVIEQLADVFLELRRFPFHKMGSLITADPPQMGGIALESLMDIERGVLRILGPYNSVADYHNDSIQLILDQILRDERYTDRPVDAYLIHLFARGLITQILSRHPPSEAYYLKHPDDKGDHILVDGECNITGIIDWEWAYAVPASVAFNSPLLLLPANDFYDGVKRLGEQELELAQVFERSGHMDMAAIVRNGRLQHRFTFCCGYDLADWDGFLGLFRALRDAVNIDAGLGWDEWKRVALDRYISDPGLKSLVAREKVRDV